MSGHLKDALNQPKRKNMFQSHKASGHTAVLFVSRRMTTIDHVKKPSM